MIFGKHINKYYLRYMHFLIIGIFSLLLVDIYQLKIPELYRMIINGIENGYVETNDGIRPFGMDFVVDEICMPLIFIIIVLVGGRFLWRVCLFGAAIRVETDLRYKMFDHSKKLSQSYYSKNKVGNLMSLYTNDLETIQECFGDGALMLFDALILGGLAIYKMARMHLVLTALSLIPMALLLVIGSLVGRHMKSKWRVRQEVFSELSDFSQESFSGIAVVKAFVKEFCELWQFKKINEKNEKANIDYTRASVTLHVLVTLFVESVICIVLGYGGYLVYNGRFSSGALVEFIGYFNSIVWPVMAISQLIDMRSRGKASLLRVSELLDTRIDVCDKDNVKDIDEIFGDIEFKNLTFKYPDSSYNALKNVSFSIQKGENVGIIGKTGAGKTTIVDLILRTYNVADNSIFIDSVDINKIPIKTLRKYFAYVPQDNFLFSDTIKNNVDFACGESDMEKIKEAASLAGVHDNISEFQEGYDTVLGERGVTVSGGQKQRISIARALMKEAAVLILDDSVSAVDTDTERTIIKNLARTRKGKTTIFIAHRVSTVKDMDKIIFIEDGRVTAVGTHSELLVSEPRYKKIVELQRLEEEKYDE